MGNNNILLNTLINAAMPTVEKLVGSGKIDNILQQLKKTYGQKVSLWDGESIEILVSTEDDGCEYLNIVILGDDKRIGSVLYQRKLSETIVELLKESKKCQ